MLVATRGIEFSFNNQMYKQLDGVAMGNPLGRLFPGGVASPRPPSCGGPGCYYMLSLVPAGQLLLSGLTSLTFKVSKFGAALHPKPWTQKLKKQAVCDMR